MFIHYKKIILLLTISLVAVFAQANIKVEVSETVELMSIRLGSPLIINIPPSLIIRIYGLSTALVMMP